MTPAELKRGIEALTIKLKQLKAGEQVGYWQLMDLLDHGSPELSKALDGELHRLQATGELVFVEDEKGNGSVLEKRDPKKKAPAKRAAPKKKAPAKKKAPVKRAAPKKKAPAKKKR